MTLNGSYLIFLYVCEYLRTILPHTNCMKMWRIIVMWVWPTSLQGITLGHKNKHCNINKVICYSCDGKGDTKTADKGVLQTKASRGSVILLSLMNKNTRTVVIMNTVNDGRCISKNRSVISMLPAHHNNLSCSEPALCSRPFLADILIWAGSELLARFCDAQVSFCCSFFFYPESYSSCYLTWCETSIYHVAIWDGDAWSSIPNSHVIKERPVWTAFKCLLRGIYSILGPPNWMTLAYRNRLGRGKLGLCY